MTEDPLATQEEPQEATAVVVLSERDQAVAHWLACSALPGEGSQTREQLARQLDCDPSTITRAAQKPAVRALARQLVRNNCENETLPRIFQKVMEKASEDPKFGWEVLKYLNERIGLELPVGSAIPRPKQQPPQIIVPVQVNVPGDEPQSYDQHIRRIRGVGDIVDVDDD